MNLSETNTICIIAFTFFSTKAIIAGIAKTTFVRSVLKIVYEDDYIGMPTVDNNGIKIDEINFSLKYIQFNYLITFGRISFRVIFFFAITTTNCFYLNTETKECRHKMCSLIYEVWLKLEASPRKIHVLKTYLNIWFNPTGLSKIVCGWSKQSSAWTLTVKSITSPTSTSLHSIVLPLSPF